MPPGLRIRRDLVLREARSRQFALAGELHLERLLLVRQLRRAVEEGRARLQRELVVREVRGTEGHRRTQVRERAFRRLARQAIHQVEIEVGDAGGAEVGDRGRNFVRAMDAPERRERRRVEGLCAQRHAIDARGRVAGKAAVLDRARVGLHRDLGVRRERQARGDARNQCMDRLGAEQRRRAAAQENAGHPAPGGEIEVGLEVREQRLDIGIFRDGSRCRM